MDGRAAFDGFRWNLTLQGVQFRVIAQGLVADVSDRFDITAPDLAAAISFSTASRTLGEGDGTQSFTLTLTRAAPHDIVCTIDPNGPLGTVAPLKDSDLGGVFHVVIPAGETRLTVEFQIEEDAEIEGDEILDLRLTGAAPARLGTIRAHAITLTDND